MAQLWIIADGKIDFYAWIVRINEVYGNLFGLDKIEIVYSDDDPGRFDFFLMIESPSLYIEVEEEELERFFDVTNCYGIFDNFKAAYSYNVRLLPYYTLFVAQLFTLLPFPNGYLVNFGCKTIDLEKLAPISPSVVAQCMWRKKSTIDVAGSPEFWHSL